MLLKNILLNNFRNYKEAFVEIDGAETVFLIGKNGQGKTNFLEAIYFLSFGNSFRAKKEEDVIFDQESFYSIKGLFQKKNITHKLEISYIDNKKKILYDDSFIKNRKEILHIFPSLIFKHSDIFFISGGPEYQRQYLDQILVLNYDEYAISFQQYKRILKQKKACLKNEQYEMILIYNEQIAKYGTVLVRYRKMICEYINSLLADMFFSVFGDKIDICFQYMPSWNIENLEEKTIFNHLEREKEIEKKARTCISGPQRDIIKILYNEKELKNVASTGQIRIISLLLRTIQALYYKEKQNNSMIYLFDDVLLELDTEKQMKFLSYLPKPKQSIFTFLPDEKIPMHIESMNKKFFYVDKGVIKEQ